MSHSETSRGKQILVGGIVIFLIGLFAVSLLVSWRYIPGVVGETVGVFAGLISTPFIMETSFILIGLLSVISLNIWRKNREGDEFVEIEVQEEPASGKKDQH